MAKNKIKFKLTSQGEFVASQRRTNGIDGSVSGATKVQGTKGKKAYNRKKSNNPKNWE